jgi:phosphoserine phosphatase RsbU/P
MVASGGSQSILGEYLRLFSATEVFIYVFLEIITKMERIRRVIFKRGCLTDYIIFISLFGIFSIFGTYIGYNDSYGAITNIRDLSPIIGGLIAGPYVGLAIGLIGGIHRFFLGGVTCISCSLSTILAGLFAGLIYRLNSEKLLDIIPGMLFAAAVELMHALLALLLVHPYTIALDIISSSTPQMMIANSLGIAISIIILRNTREPGS